MYTIDQELANQMVQMLTPKHKAMLTLFSATEKQSSQLEANFRKVLEEKTDPQVARAVVAYLPLLLENEMITKFINRTRNRSLRAMMPEILTAEEMSQLAQMDMMFLTKDQLKMITKIAEEYRSLSNKDWMMQLKDSEK